jgi:hypothetical protein
LRGAPVRIGGPGMIFIRNNERVLDAVSLRNHFRLKPDVRAFTSDGIEITASIFTIFSLEQPPEILTITNVAGSINNYRVIRINRTTSRIESLTDELELQDKIEISVFVNSWRGLGYKPHMGALSEPESAHRFPPYARYRRRITQAVYAQAGKPDAEDSVAWTELPIIAAVDIFRRMVSQESFDELFLPKEPEEPPIFKRFRPAFISAVCNLGIMSYQVVERRNGENSQIGDIVNGESYHISQVRPLRWRKLLRARGIRVNHAGFIGFCACDEAVNAQRLENWRARWQQEAYLTQADYDHETVLMRNHVKAEAQRQIILNLAQSFQDPKYTQEARAMKLYQALETAASDPFTQNLLPSQTIQMLGNLGYWLLPDDYKFTPITTPGVRK